MSTVPGDDTGLDLEASADGELALAAEDGTTDDGRRTTARRTTARLKTVRRQVIRGWRRNVTGWPARCAIPGCSWP